jgi:FdhE protein
MPYLALFEPSYDERRSLAALRWDAVLAARPDLQPAVALQRELLDAVMDLASFIDRGRLPRLSLPPRYLAAKLGRGIPALAGEPIPVPAPALQPTVLRLCADLAAGGAGEAATHIADQLREMRMDAGSLLTASLHRNQEAIRTGAVHRGLAPDLLWLVAELAVSPFVHALAHSLFHDAPEALQTALSAWGRGYCPACGSWPALAEVFDGQRLLRCSFCATAWETTSSGCIYCEEQGTAFVVATPDPERPERLVEVCGTCRGYLKTVPVASPSPFPLLAIADIETTDLDLAAMEHGYGRPPIKEFSLTRR